MINFQECLDKGLIRKDEKVKDRVEEEIMLAEKFLNSAKNNFNINEFDMCIIAAYNSIFHCERALLFKKEYTERSHICLTIALQQFYEDKKLTEFLRLADKIRISRREIQYRRKSTEKEEAEFVLSFAREFLNYIKVLLK